MPVGPVPVATRPPTGRMPVGPVTPRQLITLSARGQFPRLCPVGERWSPFAEATGLSLPRLPGAPFSFRPRLADERRGNGAAMVRPKAGHCRRNASALVGEGVDETGRRLGFSANGHVRRCHVNLIPRLPVHRTFPCEGSPADVSCRLKICAYLHGGVVILTKYKNI